MKSVVLAVLFAVLLRGSSPAPTSERPGRLDEGLLDPAWFASPNPIEFHTTGVVDYLWVKPGLDLKGRTLHLDRWERAIPGEDDEEIDRKKLVEMTQAMPKICMTEWEKVFKGDPRCSLAEGETRVVGRFVDINVPSFGSFAWPSQTFDLKLVDKSTGELLVAMHHRVALRAKPGMNRWCRKVAKAMSEGLGHAYAAGEVPKD